jgi:hypothetical protein
LDRTGWEIYESSVFHIGIEGEGEVCKCRAELVTREVRGMKRVTYCVVCMYKGMRGRNVDEQMMDWSICDTHRESAMWNTSG